MRYPCTVQRFRVRLVFKAHRLFVPERLLLGEAEARARKLHGRREDLVRNQPLRAEQNVPARFFLFMGEVPL